MEVRTGGDSPVLTQYTRINTGIQTQCYVVVMPEGKMYGSRLIIILYYMDGGVWSYKLHSRVTYQDSEHK